MQTPVFQQLTGLLAFVRTNLRADSHLVSGSGLTDLEYTADEVCKGIYPHKMFEALDNSVALMVPLKKAKLPALAIWIDQAEPENIDGGIGMNCTLGIQYMFLARARDVSNQAFAAHFAMDVWWTMCEIIVEDWQSSTRSWLRDTYHIDEIGIEGMGLVPPFDENVRAFEARGTMDFKRPMWDTGGSSSQVVDLASIYTDYNETGDTGASPLVQSIYAI